MKIDNNFILYLVIFLVFYMFTVFKERYPIKISILKFFNFLILILLFGFTHEMGTDNTLYERHYYSANYQDLFNLGRSGLGLKILNLLANSLKIEYELFKAFTTTSILILFFKSFNFFFKKQYFYAVFMFLGIGMTQLTQNIIKQGIAASILALSMIYILKKKPKKYIGLICLASVFHNTVILFLPFYKILKNPLKLKTKKKLFVFSLVVGLFLGNVFLTKVISYLPESDYYMMYLRQDELLGIKFNILNFIEYYVPFIVVILNRKKFNRLDKFIFEYYFYLILLTNLLLNYKYIFVRITPYFVIPIIWSYIFITFKSIKMKKVCKLIMIMFIFVIYALRTINNSALEYSNYILEVLF
ncbi:EpsG family protein [Ilyobacter polytropus]|uniref:EpsG family protein n=1 Tax=Ilyobacter polytropus (strain ATCC 51220 / DSM 2926 / LMG 16218 / CuHBu1) TaxID=572544 RepID=E3HB27_ILYPC|nr:EpsG family protein [Ilyobacter polytropus]ADO82176.1 hypothetical protein Ilyop_0388 [Ilyobacter polytropus DSM 2926]